MKLDNPNLTFSTLVSQLKIISPELREMVLELYRELGGDRGAWDKSNMKVFLEALIKTEDYAELDKKLKESGRLIRDVRRELERFLYL